MAFSRIWLVTEIYYPVKTSTGYYMTEIAEYLAYRGLEVHVICTNSIYSEGEEGSTAEEELHNGVNIHRVFIPRMNKNNFLLRTLRLLLCSFRLFFKTLSSVVLGDKLFVVTNPAFLILLMPYIAWRRKIEYTVLVHDIFPENLVAIKKLSNSKLVYKQLKYLFDKAYSNAYQCISIGRDMSEVLQSKIHSNCHIRLIPTWAENKIVYPKSKIESSISKKLSLQNKFIFQFAGNLGHAQGIDNLLKAIEMINNEKLHFLFVGAGVKSNDICSFICNRQLKDVSLVGFQDRSQQNDFLNSCDIGIVTLSDGMYGLGVPSKSYNIMAAGKPILYIGDENSEIALCIKEYTLGWVVKPNDPYALKNMIEYIYANRDELYSIQNNTRTVAETVFAKEIILERYYSLFA